MSDAEELRQLARMADARGDKATALAALRKLDSIQSAPADYQGAAGNLQSPAWVDQFNKLYDAGRFDEAKALAAQNGPIGFNPADDSAQHSKLYNAVFNQKKPANIKAGSWQDKLWNAADWSSQQPANATTGLAKGAVNVATAIPDYINQPNQDLEKLIDPNVQTIHQKRMAQVDKAAQQFTNADPSSITYKAGKFAGDIAGTGGTGSILAKGLLRVAPEAIPLAEALSSGGMQSGELAGMSGMGTKILGGAISGGASSGIVDPNSATTGAVIGGAFPPALKITGAALRHTLGATTGTGSEAIQQAYNSGKNGASEFLDNMRGNTGFGEIVDKAKQGISNMRQQRGELYRSGMVDISNDKSVIPFAPIKKAMDEISGMGQYKGVDINKNASTTIDDLKSRIDQWARLNPEEYHTPEGLDALKKSINDVRDATQHGTASRLAADKIYNAVKGQITSQAPVYSSVMKGYENASNTLKETEQSLSLGTKASEDTAIRKLQSLLRNNAQTNYGNRLDLAKNLEESGGVELLPSIAGQTMNSWMPRGMSGAIEKAGIIPAGVAVATGHLPLSALAAAPLASPRAMGELTYKAGQFAGTKAPSLLARLLNPALSSMNSPDNNTEKQRLIMALMNQQQGEQ